MGNRVVRIGVLILVLAASSSAAEERKGLRPEELGSRPIEIAADRMSADSVNNSVVFEGNVVAKQGDVTLLSDRLFAEYSRGAGAVEKVIAEGNVRVVQEGREARAPHAVFYNLEQRIVLSGGVDLLQGANSLRGETVTIYIRENRSVATGGEGGRVKAVIHPKGIAETMEKEKPGQ